MIRRAWWLVALGSLGAVALAVSWRSRSAPGDGLTRPHRGGSLVAPAARDEVIPAVVAPGGGIAEGREATRVSIPAGDRPPAGVEDSLALVTGRVTDREGRPISGVRILASGPLLEGELELEVALDSTEVEARFGPERVTTAEADGDGRFRIRVERTDRIRLAVRAPGFVGRDRELSNRAHAAEVDAGEIELVPGASLAGVVLDEAGTPVAGARILRVGPEWIQEGLSDRPSQTLLATTRGDGAFTLDTLPFGRTELLVRSEGFVPELRTLFVDADVLPEWRVTLTAASTITGRVVGGAEGKSLFVALNRWDAPYMPTGSEARIVPCAPDGTFVIDELAEQGGELWLAACDAPRLGWGETCLSPGVAARPGQRDVELQIPVPATYRVRVLGQGGSSLEGVEARMLCSPGMDFVLGVPSTTRHDPEGALVVSMIFAATTTVTLELQCEGYESFLVRRLSTESGATFDLEPVTLRPLERRPIRVLDDRTGEPVADASVEAICDDLGEFEDFDVFIAEEPRSSIAPSSWKGRTGSDGGALAPLSKDHPYRIEVVHPSYAPELLAHGSWAASGLEVRLRQGGSVSVLCRDAASGAPAVEAKIVHRTMESKFDHRFTDASGRTVFDRLAPGVHRFWPGDGDEDEDGADVLVADGELDEIELELPERVLLHGVVTEGGRPLAGAVVDEWGDEVGTDLEGRYEIPGREAGETEVHVTHPRYGLVLVQEIELTPPDTRFDVALELRSVRGFVRGDQGVAIPGASVVVATRSPDGRFEALQSDLFGDVLHETTSDEHGAFEFPAVQVQAGLYLLIEKGGYLRARLGPLAFSAAEPFLETSPTLLRAVALTVTLEGSDPSQGMLRMRATWLGAEPLEPDDGEQTAWPVPGDTQDPGRREFAFDSLAPGPWRIELVHHFESAPLDGVDVLLRAGEPQHVVVHP